MKISPVITSITWKTKTHESSKTERTRSGLFALLLLLYSIYLFVFPSSSLGLSKNFPRFPPMHYYLLFFLLKLQPAHRRFFLTFCSRNITHLLAIIQLVLLPPSRKKITSVISQFYYYCHFVWRNIESIFWYFKCESIATRRSSTCCFLGK